MPCTPRIAATIVTRRPAIRRTPSTLFLAASLALAASCASFDSSRPATTAQDQPPPLEPFEVTLPNSTASMSMIVVPGAEVPDPAVPGSTISIAPFWMSQTEVTWDMFDIFVYRLDELDAPPEGADAVSRPSKPYLPPDRGFGHAGYPAISIAYDAAVNYCAWLSARSGHTFRLATDAEWTLACNAGAVPDQPSLDDRAWHAANADGKTHPVGEKAPNALGLFDMLGNVAEWTTGPDGKPITRGGSYADPPESLTCDSRAAYSRAWQSRDPQIPKSKWWLSDGPFVGFRVVCIPQPTASP